MAQHNRNMMALNRGVAGNFSAREQAWRAWCEPDPVRKAGAVRAMASALAAGQAGIDPQWLASGDAAALWGAQPPQSPGRPARPLLVAPDAVAKRPGNSPAGRVALMHAIAHIEFNAIDLALDAVWRFDVMPPQFYADWIRVADEEAQHFQLVCEWLAGQGAAYGDCNAHDGLWQMAARTRHDLIARMALVPAVLEARGLDATPMIQQRLQRTAADLRNAKDALAVADIDVALTVLDRILQDEIGHVRIGRYWYEWLCARAGLEPDATFESLMQNFNAPWPKPPVNLAARRAAGFSEAMLGRFSQPRTRKTP